MAKKGLRITGGELAGRRFKAPAGMGTRPTSDRVKESLFAILAERVKADTAADFFAGSGALGMEALSRGARRCLFVERDPKVIRILKDNLETLGLGSRSKVIMADVFRQGGRLKALGPVELLLADPPYDCGYAPEVARLAGKSGFLAPGGWLIVEHSPRERPGTGGNLVLTDRRAYGQTEISIMHRET